MIVSKMHHGMIITSLRAVCKVTSDNQRLILKIELVFANNCQLKSFLTFPAKNWIFAR